jgi:hypothetical protein
MLNTSALEYKISYTENMYLLSIYLPQLLTSCKENAARCGHRLQPFAYPFDALFLCFRVKIQDRGNEEIAFKFNCHFLN